MHTGCKMAQALTFLQHDKNRTGTGFVGGKELRALSLSGGPLLAQGSELCACD